MRPFSVIFLPLAVCCAGVLASPLIAESPAGRTYAQAIARLTDAASPARIENMEEFNQWLTFLGVPPSHAATPAFAAEARRPLVKLLAQHKAIPAGLNVAFMTDVTLLERFQMAVLPTVRATGDTAYLPALQTLYQREIERSHWHLVDDVRQTIRALGGDAPDRPIWETAVYEKVRRDRGFYEGLRNLAGEADLDEQPTGAGGKLYNSGLPAPGTAREYDRARAERIYANLATRVQPKYLHEMLQSWILFDDGATQPFRLAWAMGNLRFYAAGEGDRVRSVTILAESEASGPQNAASKMRDALIAPGLQLNSVPSERKDADARAAGVQMRAGLRDLRIGRFLVGVASFQ